MQALMIAAPMLGLIGLGVATVGLFGRDPKSNEHTVDEYRPDPDAVRAVMCGIEVEDVRRRLSPGALAALEVLPPAPPGMRVSLPLYAEQVVAELMRKRYGTTSHADIAGRWLREAGEQARAELELAR